MGRKRLGISLSRAWGAVLLPFDWEGRRVKGVQAGDLLCECKMAEVYACLRENIVHLLLLTECLSALPSSCVRSYSQYHQRYTHPCRFVASLSALCRGLSQCLVS